MSDSILLTVSQKQFLSECICYRLLIVRMYLMSVTKSIDLHFFLKQIPFCWLCMLFVIVMEWEVLDFAAFCAGIFKHSMGARNQVGIEWSVRPARLHSLAELVP